MEALHDRTEGNDEERRGTSWCGQEEDRVTAAERQVLQEIERQLRELGGERVMVRDRGLVSTLRVGGAAFRAAVRVVDQTVEALVHLAAPPATPAAEALARRVNSMVGAWAQLMVGGGDNRVWRLAARWPAKEAQSGVWRFVALACGVAEAAEALTDSGVAEAYVRMSGEKVGRLFPSETPVGSEMNKETDSQSVATRSLDGN